MKVYAGTTPKAPKVQIAPGAQIVVLDPWPFKNDSEKMVTHHYVDALGNVLNEGKRTALVKHSFTGLVELTNGDIAPVSSTYLKVLEADSETAS